MNSVPANEDTGIIELDAHGIVTAWDASAARLYGYSEPEAIGKSFAAICSIGPSTAQHELERRLLEGRSEETVNGIHRTKDGRFIRASVTLAPIHRDGDGRSGTIVRVSPFARSSNDPLDEDRMWTWAVVETAVEGIATIDDRGILDYVNSAVCDLFGYDANELIGQNVSMLMPSPYREQHDAYIAAYIETGQQKIIGIGREVVGLRKDGTQFPVHLAVSEVLVGERRIFTGIVHDMTELQEGREEKDRLLQELNKRNREISCLFRVGESLRTGELTNQMLQESVDAVSAALSLASIVGVRIQVDGRAFTDSAFLDTRASLGEDITIGDRTRGRVELFLTNEHLDLLADPALRGERELVAAVARLLSEAIERNEAQAKVIQASKLASIGELAAGVGHEINNPVNGIINCADIILKDAEEGTNTQKFAALIRSEADRIATIVHNLLTFSRQEKETHSAADLIDIVDSVLSLCEKKLSKSYIDLQVELPQNLPRIYCRSEQLQQVLMNLVINAMHALDEKYPQANPDKILKISASEHTVEDIPFIRLTIEDHGYGIDEALKERIFDPFFTTKGRDKGTGLGLSISDGIVKDHGGSMEIESIPGEFTRFHIDLPLRPKGPSVTERSTETLQAARDRE